MTTVSRQLPADLVQAVFRSVWRSLQGSAASVWTVHRTGETVARIWILTSPGDGEADAIAALVRAGYPWGILK